MSSREQLYARLPVAAQHLAVSGAGLSIRLRRYDRRFEATLRAARERERWSEDRLHAHRESRLREHVLAASAAPYYGALFRDVGLRPSTRDLAAFIAENLPVLRKTTVREHAAQMRSAAVPRRRQVRQRTSGTTGEGLNFYTTHAALREQWATWWRYLGWHGVARNTWCGYFMEKLLVPRTQAAPPFWRYNAFNRQVMFSTQHMNEQNLPAYVDELRRRKLRWLHGYPSALALLAEHINGEGVDLGYPVEHVTLASENALAHQRRAISCAFGVAPRQHYAMTEAIANASECERGSLHLDEDFSFVELVTDPSDGLQRIVGTNFTNSVFPLLRYQTDDVVSLEPRCGCGRPGRTVRIDGRAEDYVVLRDGTHLGRLDHVFKDAVTVREAQIVQRDIGELTLRVVPGTQFSEGDVEPILADLRRRVGDDMRIGVEYRDRLPRSESGKLRLVVSDVGRGSS